jgi:hypothetical protein
MYVSFLTKHMGVRLEIRDLKAQISYKLIFKASEMAIKQIWEKKIERLINVKKN